METLLWGPQGAGWLQDPHSGLLKCEALQVSQVPHGILPPFLGGTGHWPLWNVASALGLWNLGFHAWPSEGSPCPHFTDETEGSERSSNMS